MSDLEVHLPDGSTRTLSAGSSALDLAGAIGKRLAKDALAAEVNGELTDLHAVLPTGATVAIVTPTSDQGRDILRHSTAHVLAQAVTRLWPGAHYAIGPSIRDGFYYDFALPGGEHFTEDDLPRIEGAMRAIVAEDQPFIRAEYTTHE
jgi:threonyl-tRNA synthetase